MWYYVIIVLIIVIYHNYIYEQYIYGFWVADDNEFCHQAGIKSMLLFIGEPTGVMYTTRTCYIIIMDNMSNQSFTLQYIPFGWFIGKYRIYANVEFSDEQIWESRVCIDVNMTNGTLEISAGDIVYARLTKQHETTNITRNVDVEL
jgi:hypothetical protein